MHKLIIHQSTAQHSTAKESSASIVSSSGLRERTIETEQTDKEQGGRSTRRSVDWRVGGFRSEREREKEFLDSTLPSLLRILLEGIATN
jgi:vacuolar-type H+-ATPase subunit E/Vma4